MKHEELPESGKTMKHEELPENHSDPMLRVLHNYKICDKNTRFFNGISDLLEYCRCCVCTIYETIYTPLFPARC